MKFNLVLMLLNLIGLVLFIATWSPVVWGVYQTISILILIALGIIVHLKGKVGEIVRKWYWRIFVKKSVILLAKNFPMELETSILAFTELIGEEKFMEGLKEYDTAFKQYVESDMKNY